MLRRSCASNAMTLKPPKDEKWRKITIIPTPSKTFAMIVATNLF